MMEAPSALPARANSEGLAFFVGLARPDPLSANGDPKRSQPNESAWGPAAMDVLLADLRHEFSRHKHLADRAIAALDEEAYFRRPGESVNSVALVIKHMAGNLASRWTDFLTTDGEKPGRNRDGEFVQTEGDTRPSLSAAWEGGWAALFGTIDELGEADLDRTVTIRGEPHTVRQALLRGLTHAAYHVGQITYLARLLNPDAPWLTIPPGQSGGQPGTSRGAPPA
jgi:uncharacterized damage-inducible protein DinB